MTKIKGPAIFLAQYVSDDPPFNTLESIAKWVSDCGFEGIQIPSWDARLFDLKTAAESQLYCDEIKGALNSYGVSITELSTHLQGQLIAVHPAYDPMYDSFAPADLKNNPKCRQEWATNQLHLAAKASHNLGLSNHATFSGALAWPYFYPWPQRPEGLVEMAFDELASRWLPILNAFDEVGVNLCFEIHPGEDLQRRGPFASGQEQRSQAERHSWPSGQWQVLYPEGSGANASPASTAQADRENERKDS